MPVMQRLSLWPQHYLEATKLLLGWSGAVPDKVYMGHACLLEVLGHVGSPHAHVGSLLLDSLRDAGITALAAPPTPLDDAMS